MKPLLISSSSIKKRKSAVLQMLSFYHVYMYTYTAHCDFYVTCKVLQIMSLKFRKIVCLENNSKYLTSIL